MQTIDYKELTAEQREAYGFVRLTDAKLAEGGYVRTAAGIAQVKRWGKKGFRKCPVKPIAAGEDKQ